VFGGGSLVQGGRGGTGHTPTPQNPRENKGRGTPNHTTTSNQRVEFFKGFCPVGEPDYPPPLCLYFSGPENGKGEKNSRGGDGAAGVFPTGLLGIPRGGNI